MLRKSLDVIVMTIVDAVLLMVLMGADCEQARLDALDEGFHVAASGVEVQPGVLPALTASADYEAASYIPDAVQWWAASLESEAFIDDGIDDADVTVEFGYVPAPAEDAWSGDFDLEGFPLGIAYVDFDATGAVTFCAIVISSDIEYHAPTVAAVLRHELGHCLGLADDPDSIDLNSVMASPLLPDGELTSGDFARLQPYLP